MKLYPVAIVAMLTVWAAPSHAQYYDPGMVNNQANIFLNAEINRVTIDSGSARSSGSSNRSRPSQRSTNAPIPPATMDRLKETVIDVLDPEYARRVAAYGPASSQNWVSTTLKSVGGQVGALRSEYHRRVRSSGQGAADNWLTSRTRQIASSYVSPTTRTDGTTSSAAPASTGVVPDHVLSRMQATALTNLQGEYHRRVSSYGRADADRWMNAAAREVGRQTGALGPEYLRRVGSQGDAQAADWYEAQVREISRRYVENGQQ